MIRARLERDMSSINQADSWLEDTTISCAFVFSPGGDITWASLNCPGSWRDATVASHLFDRLLDSKLPPDPYFIFAGSVFPHQGPIGRKIHTPLSRQEHQQGSMAAIEYSTSIVSTRQATEWDMGTIQAKFPRLAVPLPVNDRRRLVICKVVVLLCNPRVRKIGLSQVSAVFPDS
jgi:hypothetical protein